MTPNIKEQVQLAHPITKYQPSYPCYGEVKHDGVRALAFCNAVHNECYQVEIYTRAGNRIRSLRLESQIRASIRDIEEENYEQLASFVLEGEIVCQGGRMSGVEYISGKVNSALTIGELDEDDCQFVVFDCLLRESEFDAKVCTSDYCVRLERLKDFIQFTDKVVEVERRTIYSEEEAMAWYDELEADGFEGLVMKPVHYKYAFKRTRDWIKIKAIKTADLECIGCEDAEEGSKYDGMIGALVLSGEVEGKDITVRVGSGLTDPQRDLPPDYYIGKTIEVKYNKVSVNKSTGIHSLRQPRFVRMRFDK